MPDEPTPKVGDLFTRDYVSFYRVQHMDDLSNLPADPRGLALTKPVTVLHLAPGADWTKAVTSYRSVPGNETVQVWDANASVPTLVSVTE